MGIYYEMLRPVNKDDLERASSDSSPDIIAVLKDLSPGRYVSANMLKGRADKVQRALEWACINDVMRKTTMNGAMMDFESVRFWVTQLNSSKMKNVKNEKGTKTTYMDALEKFNRWLADREFPIKEDQDDKQVKHKSFSDVEDMLRFCENSDHGVKIVRRVVKEYLSYLATATKYSLSTAMVRCAAIKSYFATHDMSIDVKVNRKRHAVHDVREPSEMNMFEFYKIMTGGKMDAMTKAVMMIKMQAGLDASTLADRFNFEAYGQIIKYFGIDDYESWDLDKCPVPIRLVRVKTGMTYTTFIDRDAVLYLQDYLRRRNFKHNKKYDGTEPLFMTNYNRPISPRWISTRFFKAAVNAGVQKRVASNAFKIQSHEVRDLLKSTLMISGCAQYVADHVLGHAPRDTYEKQATLYPQTLREEYSKASGRLNIFTGIEMYLTGADTTRPEWRQSEHNVKKGEKGDEYHKLIETQRQEMRTMSQKMSGAIIEILRSTLLTHGKDAKETDTVRRILKNLEEGDTKDEE